MTTYYDQSGNPITWKGGSSGGAPQTPWTSDIDAASYKLMNAGNITATSATIPLVAGTVITTGTSGSPTNLTINKHNPVSATSHGPLYLKMPNPASCAGLMLSVTDLDGNFDSLPTTVKRYSGEMFNNLSADLLLSTRNGSWQFFCADATNWLVFGPNGPSVNVVSSSTYTFQASDVFNSVVCTYATMPGATFTLDSTAGSAPIGSPIVVYTVLPLTLFASGAFSFSNRRSTVVATYGRALLAKISSTVWNLTGDLLLGTRSVSSSPDTFLYGDAGNEVQYSVACTVTLPNDTNAGLGGGESIQLTQTGTGQITIKTDATACTVDGWSAAGSYLGPYAANTTTGLKSPGQGSTIVARKLSSNPAVWRIFGAA
jgi:hypothetical protein